RYFALADSYGIDPQRIASDRGLAYDLIGEQERAQREYRVALKSQVGDQEDRDEAARRYALSLGISGRGAQALEVIDPLLRKQDRGAWRARAFVLAMNGKGAEATRIATTTLPAGMAQGLQPFFDRLP
ncbi:tetratricopeptide repeat protein, partial [Listeria monocytogenes]|uniref:tetratricopeptide repeat protein n=1 Tax=Listeria monocytogenes TaxID=1639 RepID=UPI0011400B17